MDEWRGKHTGRSAISGWRRVLLIVLCAANAGLILLGLAVGIYEHRYQARIYAGVSVVGTPLGGLTQDAAIARLAEALRDGDLPYVVLCSGDSEWTIASSELGGYVDINDTVAEAWAFGRSGVFRTDMISHARALLQGYNLEPVFEIEPSVALVSLRRIARLVSHPSDSPHVGLEGLQTAAANVASGYDLDVDATCRNIKDAMRKHLGPSGYGNSPTWLRAAAAGWPNALAAGDAVRASLAFREVVSPVVSTEGAQEHLAALLAEPVTLTAELTDRQVDGHAQTVQRNWLIDRALLASWLTATPVQAQNPDSPESASLVVGVASDRVRAYLERLSLQIDRPPREARFDLDTQTGELIALCPGQDGYALDVSAATALLTEACLSTEARHVSLPVHIVAPRVTREDLDALMPLSLISVGQSDFTGSTPDRLQNIKRATSSFHGLVVPPQSSFSFLDYLGDVSVANGYSQSWIILGEETILGPGGGVCQVSTTCFRAAFWGGFPIVERWPHTYRVSWYEPPLGLDAAVFSPDTDMKFTNDLTTPILILTEVDEQNAKLHFRFYGAPLNRTVSMQGPATANPVPAGAPVIVQDASLAPGQRVVQEWPHDGIDVTIYRLIETADGVTTREEIFSRYVPWAARYRVGPSAENP